MNFSIFHVIQYKIKLLILHWSSNKFDDFYIFPIETIQEWFQVDLFYISIEKFNSIVVDIGVVVGFFSPNCLHSL